MTSVLVTGGAGYIGSQVCKALAGAGHLPVSYDILSRGHRSAVKWGPLIVGEIEDVAHIARTLRQYEVEAVIHLAALAYVGESYAAPLLYYQNNVAGTVAVLQAMYDAEVRQLIFSSSCAVYGIPDACPIDETFPLKPISPYGMTKMVSEQIIADTAQTGGLSWAALRYFNVAGADLDGEIGARHDPETRLVQRALMACMGLVDELELYGTDYETADGTCVRDYVHVVDIARAHVAALAALAAGDEVGTLNIGVGDGYSVREILCKVSEIVGREVPLRIAPRRPGDPAVLYADASRARQKLDFSPLHSDLTTIVTSAWNWLRVRDHA